MGDLLKVEDLHVEYRGRGRRADKHALQGITVQLGAGETLGVVGESGSGKSTLGNCVLGLVRPTSGRLLFDGHDLTHLRPKDRRAFSGQIQAVFQDPYSTFNPHRTIEQSVGETLPRSSSVSASERRHRIIAMLERVGLDQSALAKYPAQFSGGQRQRISIARALLPDPRLVVCDESVSALDLSVQAQVLNMLLELQQERDVAYLFITHDLAVVRHVSTRIAVLEHGRLVEEGSAEDVTERPSHGYTRRLIEASPVSNPRVQNARRRTRRLRQRIEAGTPAPAPRADELDTELVNALEVQAVIEATEGLATNDDQPAEDRASLREGQPTANELEMWRAALLELAPRTSAATLGPATASRVTESRAAQHSTLGTQRCDVLALRYAELVTSIGSARRDDAIAVLNDLHRQLTTTGDLGAPRSPSETPPGTVTTR